MTGRERHCGGKTRLRALVPPWACPRPLASTCRSSAWRISRPFPWWLAPWGQRVSAPAAMLRLLCPRAPLAQAGALRPRLPRLSGTLGLWPLPSKTQPPSSPWGRVPAASLGLAVAVVSRICPAAGPLLPAVGWSVPKAPAAHSCMLCCAKSLQSCLTL